VGLVERVSYWFLRENSGGGVEGRERGKAPSRSPVFTSRPLLLFFFFFLFFLFFFFFFFFFFFHARLFAERGAAGEIKRSSVRGAGKEGGSGSLSREISVSLPFLFRSSFVHSFFLSRESLLAKVLLSLLHRRRDVVLLLLQLARSLVLRVNHRLFALAAVPSAEVLACSAASEVFSEAAPAISEALPPSPEALSRTASAACSTCC
jgi:hypothetical protein